MFAVLDDAEALSTKDASGMLEQIMALPSQLEFSLSKSIYLEPDTYSNVCICGLGGSAMSGDILRDYMNEHSSSPIIVVRDTQLPKWVNENTFALILSYSGNTIETLYMYEEAKAKGAKIVGVTSGGKLKDLFIENNNPFIEVPSGLQPRAALGYMLGACAVVMKSANLCNIADDLKALIPRLEEECRHYAMNVPVKDNLAKRVADRLENSLPAVYGTVSVAPAASRWRTQINENAKMLSMCGILPEFNHNQIVGWISTPSAPATAVFLRSVMDSVEITKIVDATTSLFNDSGVDTLVLNLEGESKLECTMRGIILGDFVSFYLAALHGVDPTPIDPISKLKERVSQN